MRRYSYRDRNGDKAIFGGQFELEIRGDFAVVLLADHLIPLTVSEIPTQIYLRFLSSLEPSAITFVEFDTVTRQYHLLDLRWTETAGAFRFLRAAAMSEAMVRSFGLAAPKWIQAVELAIGTPRGLERGARAGLMRVSRVR
jgi:hypothetical protein